MRSFLLVVFIGVLFLSMNFAYAKETSKTETIIKKNTIDNTIVENESPEFWGLTKTEWKRYKLLMQGAQASWTPNETPTFVLGLNARSDLELRRYAELEVKVQKKRHEQSLAFGKYYAEAWQRLYPEWTNSLADYFVEPSAKQRNKIIFDNNSHAFSSGSLEDIQINGDSLVAFISQSCDNFCRDKVKQLIRIGLEKRIPVNLFFEKMTSQAAVGFARSINLPPQLTRSKQVTINYNQDVISSLLSKLKIKNNVEPSKYYMTRSNDYVALQF